MVKSESTIFPASVYCLQNNDDVECIADEQVSYKLRRCRMQVHQKDSLALRSCNLEFGNNGYGRREQQRGPRWREGCYADMEYLEGIGGHRSVEGRKCLADETKCLPSVESKWLVGRVGGYDADGGAVQVDGRIWLEDGPGKRPRSKRISSLYSLSLQARKSRCRSVWPSGR